MASCYTLGAIVVLKCMLYSKIVLEDIDINMYNTAI